MSSVEEESFREKFKKVHSCLNKIILEKRANRDDRPFKSINIDRLSYPVESYLNCISKGEWVEDEAIFDLSEHEYADNSLQTIVTDISKILAYACAEEKIGRIMVVGKIPGEKRRHRLFWKQDKQTARKREGYGSVLVVGNLRSGEWNSEIMRGVRSMARELDIKLIDRMKRDWLKGVDLQFNPNPISAILSEAGVSHQECSILVRNRDHNELGGEVRRLQSAGYHVVTTGFTNGMIRQGLEEIGTILAQQCIEDQRRLHDGNDGEGFLVIVHRYPDLEGNTTAIQRMQHSFTSALAAEGARFEFAEFKVTPYYGLHYDFMRKEYREFYKGMPRKYGKKQLAAIFVPDESYGLAALHEFENEDKDLCRVYCERLVRTLLETPLIDNAKHVHAACGMEPYYFGRYAMRAACQKMPTYEEAAPVLVTGEEINLFDLTSPDRIPPFFGHYDVQYNHPKYAWHKWMRERCGEHYGPDLYDNRANLRV